MPVGYDYGFIGDTVKQRAANSRKSRKGFLLRPRLRRDKWVATSFLTANSANQANFAWVAHSIFNRKIR